MKDATPTRCACARLPRQGSPAGNSAADASEERRPCPHPRLVRQRTGDWPQELEGGEGAKTNRSFSLSFHSRLECRGRCPLVTARGGAAAIPSNQLRVPPSPKHTALPAAEPNRNPGVVLRKRDPNPFDSVASAPTQRKPRRGFLFLRPGSLPVDHPALRYAVALLDGRPVMRQRPCSRRTVG
jgi:hypothetical protein